MENTIFFNRIIQIIGKYEIKSVNSFAREHLNYKSSEKINRLKKENAKPSFDILLDIANKFEDISMDWLITGIGPMLKSEIYSTGNDNVNIFNEDRNKYIIASQEALINELYEKSEQLKVKDEQIKARDKQIDKFIDLLDEKIGFILNKV